MNLLDKLTHINVTSKIEISGRIYIKNYTTLRVEIQIFIHYGKNQNDHILLMG